MGTCLSVCPVDLEKGVSNILPNHSMLLGMKKNLFILSTVQNSFFKTTFRCQYSGIKTVILLLSLTKIT